MSLPSDNGARRVGFSPMIEASMEKVFLAFAERMTELAAMQADASARNDLDRASRFLTSWAGRVDTYTSTKLTRLMLLRDRLLESGEYLAMPAGLAELLADGELLSLLSSTSLDALIAEAQRRVATLLVNTSDPSEFAALRTLLHDDLDHELPLSRLDDSVADHKPSGKAD